jgi:hypothetical protein
MTQVKLIYAATAVHNYKLGVESKSEMTMARGTRQNEIVSTDAVNIDEERES